MANVINFPTKSVRDWQAIEKGLRKIFKRAAFGKEMTDHLCSVMKGYFKKYDIKFTLNVALPAEASNKTVLEPIQQAADKLSKQIHEIVYQMLVHDILRLHVELYTLKGSKPPAG